MDLIVNYHKQIKLNVKHQLMMVLQIVKVM